MSTPLYGLLLTGGHSKRMQRDKANLEYAGQSQLARAMALLEPLVARTLVSVRADQLHDPQRASYACIADVLPNLGPIGGIHAALQAHPQVAWLVLACDLPFLDTATLQQLIAARDTQRPATAFRSNHDGKPEPLCAIYEPASAHAIDHWIASGQRCPRGLLAASGIPLLELRSPHALDNVNTAAEYAAAQRQVGDGTVIANVSASASAGAGASDRAPLAQRTFKVQYFALLREQAGRNEETVVSKAKDARELYEELRQTRNLKLRPEQLRVAINENFGDWSQLLHEGDAIVFLPPVAGG